MVTSREVLSSATKSTSCDILPNGLKMANGLPRTCNSTSIQRMFKRSKEMERGRLRRIENDDFRTGAVSVSLSLCSAARPFFTGTLAKVWTKRSSLKPNLTSIYVVSKYQPKTKKVTKARKKMLKWYFICLTNFVL